MFLMNDNKIRELLELKDPPPDSPAAKFGKRIEKKILPEYYEAVRKRVKNFELRKDDDDIQVNDILTLREWDGEKYTGHKITRIVTYVLRDCPQYGLMEGYCIIGIMPIGWDTPYVVLS